MLCFVPLLSLIIHTSYGPYKGIIKLIHNKINHKLAYMRIDRSLVKFEFKAYAFEYTHNLNGQVEFV